MVKKREVKEKETKNYFTCVNCECTEFFSRYSFVLVPKEGYSPKDMEYDKHMEHCFECAACGACIKDIDEAISNIKNRRKK